MGHRAFSCAAPRLCNSLPANIRNLDSLSQFKAKLKTNLFRIAYPTWWLSTLKCSRVFIYLFIFLPLSLSLFLFLPIVILLWSFFYGSLTLLFIVIYCCFLYCSWCSVTLSGLKSALNKMYYYYYYYYYLKYSTIIQKFYFLKEINTCSHQIVINWLKATIQKVNT